MVSEVGTSPSLTNFAPQSSVEIIPSHGNTAYCETASVTYAGFGEHRQTPSQDVVPSIQQSSVVATKQVKLPSHAVLEVCKSLIAGGVAGGVSRTAVAPLERLKILLQVQNPANPQYKGMWQGLKAIGQSEGLRGFFRGNGANCVRIIPNSAVKFYSYEQTANGLLWLVRQRTGNEDAELTPTLRLAAGATAGIIAMSAVYPLDMVRGRLTVQTADSPQQYRGLVHAMVTITREEGVRALYRGWLPSVLGVIPYVGLNFSVYETLKDWMIKGHIAGATENGELSVMTKLGCGGVAGTVGQTVAYPLDVVRRRMQMVGWKDAGKLVAGSAEEQPRYNGMVDAFRQIYRNEGIFAFYRGLVPNSVKVVPSIAIAFVTYEVMRDLMHVQMKISA